MIQLDYLLQRKSILFVVVFSVVVGSLALPIILPHIFHGFHIIHIFLHVAGITLSAFLTLIASFAYYRLRTKRMLLTMIAFMVFAFAESVVLIDATWPFMYSIGMTSLLEIGHLLIIISMGLLAMGAFRND